MKSSLVAVGLFALLLVVWLIAKKNGITMGRGADDVADIHHSGQGFETGDLFVELIFGYSDDGDRLRFMIIQTWPRSSTFEQRIADTRVVHAGIRPLVRHNDGTMRPVGIDGHVYLFDGEQLRMMRVKMNEHSDTHELTQVESIERMWAHLQQFRVADSE